MNTDAYSKARGKKEQDATFTAIKNSAEFAASIGLRVVAGHGLNYLNARKIAMLPQIEELNIGHNIIARATLVGLDRAVSEMVALISRP